MLLVALVSVRELGRRAFFGFAGLAPVLIALLVVAGLYLSILRLRELGDLWTTSYGQILMVKLGLVGLALTWGAVHHFVVEPRLDRPGIVSRLPRSVTGAAALGIAVLLSPPSSQYRPASASGRRHQLERGAGGVGCLQGDPSARPRRGDDLAAELHDPLEGRDRSSTPK